MGSCCSKRKPQPGQYIRYHESKKKNPKKLGHSTYDEPNILIIGAGVAGLACAVELQNNGFEQVRIVEMSDRIGGRIRTIKFADNCVDLGAQLVQGQNGNIIYGMVAETDMLSPTRDIFSRMEWIRSNGDTMSRAIVTKLVGALSNIIHSKQHDVEYCHSTFWEYLVEKFSEEMKKPTLKSVNHVLAAEFLRTFKKMEGNTTDSDMSASTYDTFQPCSGGLFNWRDAGFKKFLQLLVHGDDMNEQGQLKGSIDLNTRVLKINWDRVDGTVEVTCEQKQYIVDHVVVTVSLGVLKKNNSLFVPCLPQVKRKAINFLGFGSVCKIFIEFDDPWWQDSWPGFNVMWRTEDLSQPQLEWVADIYAFHRYAFQPRVLLGWASGPYTELIETLDSRIVTQGVWYMLRRFLPNIKIPQPKRVCTSHWSIDPAYLGVYSYSSILTNCYNCGHEQLAQPVNMLTYDAENNSLPNNVPMSVRPVLLFAGEATSANHFSTVHGAIETGLREARRLRGYYQKDL